jgi:hypothetical protein
MNNIDSRIFASDKAISLNYAKVNDENETVRKIMRICWDALNNDCFKKIRSSSGVTGITYICQLTRQALIDNDVQESDLPFFARVDEIDRDTQKDLLFILKSLNKESAENEKFCADLFRKFELNTPRLYFVGSEKIKGNVTGQSLIEKIHGTVGDSNELIFMFGFEATTLKDLITSKALFELKTEDLEKIFSTMGQVAIFDLLIANDDRFFRHNSENPSRVGKFLNEGNIMFDLKITGNKERTFSQAFIIDNATTQNLKPLIETSYEDMDFNNLFGEDNLNPEDMQSPTPSAKTLSKDFAPYSEAFEYYTNTQNQPEFSQVIAEGFIDGVNQLIKNTNNNNFLLEDELPGFNIPFIQKQIEVGFDIALKKIQTSGDFEFEDIESEYCKTTSNLISSALNKKHSNQWGI